MLKNELIALIEKKRAELVQAANMNGFTSTIAIRRSQELDQLINEYNRNYIKKVPSQPISGWTRTKQLM
ncbi:aspartyl-phosphate phosphatase Spo0E family protein [Neobacillus sp. YIM B02564]|uniref:Aspartyl-phosphate phosphatase Spo0E family protein n=1 Tax=Neobacillus paridis TaxID=2803862 RepID=A0ABS1TS82_9BACI|nr:aspartyl-phosphate phosphatase Spo0E family protein [Neobacillus paridis]